MNLEAINWVDNYYIDQARVVLTKAEMQIPGLRTFGHHELTKATSALKMHYHQNAFEITYVVKGNVIFQVKDHEYHLSGGDVFITFPDEVHDTASAPITINEMFWIQLDVSDLTEWLFLGEKWVQDLVDSLFNIHDRVIKISQKEMHPIISRCFSLLYKQNPHDRYEAVTLLLTFLQKLVKYDKETMFRLTPDIGAVVDFILNNLSENITMDEMAQMSRLSISRFKQKFKLQVGVTPREFVNSQKLETAKNMLANGLSVTDIAMNLGFSSSNYFAVVFKKYTTVSPTEFLRKINNG